jgi:DNA-binding CsgD family transcriptional regulator
VLGSAVVGRETELTEVVRFLGSLKRGFATLILEGEPGIGKSTVWLEARRRAHASDVRVLWCRPSAAEAKFSFAGVADLLSSVDESAFDSLPGPQREALEVAMLRASPSRRTAEERAVAAGFLTLVRELAAGEPLLIAVDDWQWLDAPSRGVLEFAARRLESESVGLLSTLRSSETRSSFWSTLRRDRLRSLTVGPLSLAALGRILGDEFDRSFPRPLLLRISQASRGNPFYALEIARLLLERGIEYAPGFELPVPHDLRKLTEERIRRLPASARDALLLAAIQSAPDSRTVDTDALAPAEEAGIVAIDERGRIEFAHPLLASSALHLVATARRRELHRQVAELVSDSEQRARHLALGCTSPDAQIAAQLDQAAAVAAWRGAPQAAAELAELAAHLTPADDPGARGTRLMDAARSHFDAGDLKRAGDLAEEVLVQQHSSQLRAEGLQLAGRVRARQNNFSEAAGRATEALALAPDARLQAGIELDLVYCAVSLGDLAGATSHARAAVEAAQAAGENGMLGDALAVLTMAEFLSGHGVERERLAQAQTLEDPAMPRAWIMRPMVIRGMIQLWTGELTAALQTLETVHIDSIERGVESFTPMLALYRVWAAVWQGDLTRAAQWSDEGRTAASLVGDPNATGIALAASALVHAHDGHTDLARHEAGESLALFERLQWRSGMIWPLWALGLAALSDGSPVETDAALRPLTEQVAAMGAGDPVLMTFLPDEVEALIALGELGLAETYLAPFEARARSLERPWALAAAARCRGMLAAAAGDSELAFAAFDRALAEHERAPFPFERARTLLLAGQAYRRYKQRARAREALTAALELFDAVGAPQWSARAGAELGRVGRVADGSDDLSETERRVAELAASGLSNQEIAERAFLSVKTVEGNLTRAYRKLGVRSRVELANEIRERDSRVAGSGQA